MISLAGHVATASPSTCSNTVVDAPVAGAHPHHPRPSLYTARKLGIAVWLRDQSKLTSHQQAVVLLLIDHITVCGGSWFGAIGTLAANTPTSVSTLERCLPECIRTGLLVRTEGAGGMFTYRLGPTLQGQQLEALLEAGRKQAAYQTGMNCPGSQRGDWSREYPASWRRAQQTGRPKVVVVTEAEVVAGPSLPPAEGAPGPEPDQYTCTPPVEGGTGTDSSIGYLSGNYDVSSTVLSTVTNSGSFSGSCIGNHKGSSGMTDNNDNDSDGGTELGSDHTHSKADDVAAVVTTPPSSHRAIARPSEGGTRPQRKLINGLANPLNVEAGAAVVWRNTECTVLNAYCWERDQYLVSHPTDGSVWVEASQLTVSP